MYVYKSSFTDVANVYINIWQKISYIYSTVQKF